jgi:prepilin-type processing-associated H-X9-DG protein
MLKKTAICEVVTVLLIVTALVAIVVPVIGVTEQDKTARCAANGKRVVAALLMYMSDWNGRFPNSATDEEFAKLRAITWHYTWPGYIDPSEKLIWDATMGYYRWLKLRNYVKDQSIWICTNPAALYVQRYAFGFKCSWFGRDSDNFVDGDRGFQDDHAHAYGGRTIAEVEALDLAGTTKCGPRYLPPNKKIIAMCYAIGRWGTWGIGNSNWRPDIFPSYSHGSGSVFAYADGHVKWAKMGTAWAPVGYTTLDIDKDPDL